MLYLSVEDMPGPTQEARDAQYRQVTLREAFYDAVNAAEDENDDVVKAARAAYNKSVEDLETLLGTEVHCNFVDCDLWGAFSDAYKAEAGFRPHGVFKTRQQVLDWCSKHGFSTIEP